jgi:hypothetical protein
MPRLKGGRISARRSNLTDYGIWLWRIADKLGVDDTIIAQRSGEISQENKISQGTISKSTRFSADGEEVLIPTLTTTRKIFTTFEMIAQEQGKRIPHEVKKLFYNASPAQYATDEEAAASHLCIQWIEQYVSKIDGASHSPDEDN